MSMCLCVIVWTYWYILLCESVYIDTFYTIHLLLHTSYQSIFHCVPIYVWLCVCVCVCTYVYVDIFCMMCLFFRALSHVIMVPIPIHYGTYTHTSTTTITCKFEKQTKNFMYIFEEDRQLISPPLCAVRSLPCAAAQTHTHTHASTQLHKSKLADSEEVSRASRAMSIAFFAYTAHKHAHKHARTQTCTHTCTHMHTRMYTSHTHTRTHTHTHTHKHTLSLSLTHT